MLRSLAPAISKHLHAQTRKNFLAKQAPHHIGKSRRDRDKPIATTSDLSVGAGETPLIWDPAAAERDAARPRHHKGIDAKSAFRNVTLGSQVVTDTARQQALAGSIFLPPGAVRVPGVLLTLPAHHHPGQAQARTCLLDSASAWVSSSMDSHSSPASSALVLPAAKKKKVENASFTFFSDPNFGDPMDRRTPAWTSTPLSAS